MFEKRLTRTLSASAAFLVIALLVPAAPAAEEKAGLDLSTKKDALRAIDLGLQWLRTRQAADGSWSLKQYPAITALATRALLQDPARDKSGELDPIASRGLDYLVSCARKDGGIYCDVPKERGGSLRNYNTAASLETLGAARQSRYEPLVVASRRFLIQSQHLKKDVFYGGWGYDEDLKRPYADMMNTGFAIEALRTTTPAAGSSSLTAALSKVEGAAASAKPGDSTAKPAPDKAAGDATDPDWTAAAVFLSRCQNRPDGTDKAVSNRPQDAGGFYYQPLRGMAGGDKDAEGRPTWYSYGNATALGLACLLESDITRDDPRVTGCVNWLRSNYNIQEHPGLGKEGLYFYYHSLAAALSLYGEDPLKGTGGKNIPWRRELMIKIVSLQRVDEKTGFAYWVNDEGRWMENDPVLVTAYCTLALEALLNEPPAARP